MGVARMEVGREQGGVKGADSSPWFIFSASLSADLMAAGLLLLRIQFCRTGRAGLKQRASHLLPKVSRLEKQQLVRNGNVLVLSAPTFGHSGRIGF